MQCNSDEHAAEDSDFSVSSSDSGFPGSESRAGNGSEIDSEKKKKVQFTPDFFWSLRYCNFPPASSIAITKRKNT